MKLWLARDEGGSLHVFMGYIPYCVNGKWFNKDHFDCRDLIPMGLATDATRLNIY